MTDAANPTKPIVNFDNGETWPRETIALDHPFTLKGVRYDAISLRAATGLDIERYFADEQRTVPQFVKSLCDAPEEVWGHMHALDFRKVYEVGKRFLG